MRAWVAAVATLFVAAAATTADAQNALTGRVVGWSSNNPGVATVNASGLVRAVAPGTTAIVATSEGVTGSAQLTGPGVAVQAWKGARPMLPARSLNRWPPAAAW